MTTQLFARHALLPTGWAPNVLVQWDKAGLIRQVQTHVAQPPGQSSATELLVPGMPNLHSHAFQRASAGLTEYRYAEQDSFWSWRNLMYSFAAHITPEQLEAIATWLYAEMLEAGYTSVCEFHYVHHQPDGQPYADSATLSQCLLNAAKRTGIGMTLLPVLYQTGGFGALPPGDGQKRFIHTTDAMLKLLDKLLPQCQAQNAKLGIAPHSLRAVPPESLNAIIEGMNQLDATAPIHIHIAEQTKEVDDCIAWCRQRPVEWLMDHMAVDARWCLVHATHMNASEYQQAASSGAIAGLCPTTEANLGDGIFDLPQWLQHQGRWGIGSDSHVTVNAAAELLALEYSQRLQRRQRNVAASTATPSVAQNTYLQAVQGGAQASGRPIAGIAVGQNADLVELDCQHRALAQLTPDQALSGHVFGSSRTSAIRRVWTQGILRVDQKHLLHQPAQKEFIQARTQLLRHIHD